MSKPYRKPIKRNMTVEQVIEAVKYATGHGCPNDEAEEILDFYNQNEGASLDEIIGDYYIALNM